MKEKSEKNGRSKSFSTIVLFLLFGGTIGAATYVNIIPQDIRTGLKVGMIILSSGTWLFLARRERFQEYKNIVIGFFAISLGVLLSQYFGDIPMKLLGVSVSTVKGVSMAKFGEAIPIIISILVFHFATGGKMNDLFLRRGNLKLGLTAGIIGFSVFTGVALFQVVGSGLQWPSVAKELPWILIFIFSNAFLEELWFRALFLKKLEALIGARKSLVITSLVFAGVHISATYIIDVLVFMVAVLALGLVWGWLMQKSDSIWGSVLIHAGVDVVAMLGFIAGAYL